MPLLQAPLPPVGRGKPGARSKGNPHNDRLVPSQESTEGRFFAYRAARGAAAPEVKVKVKAKVKVQVKVKVKVEVKVQVRVKVQVKVKV